jgi:hypothetical protein
MIESDDQSIRKMLAELYPPGPERERWLKYFRAMREAPPIRRRMRWSRASRCLARRFP